MTWNEAVGDTLELWRRIRASIPTADELDLLTRINAVCALCQKAEEVAGDPLRRCDACLAFQQFGGCRGADALMSERIAAHDREGLTRLVDDFIARLEALELPDPGAA